MDKLLKNQAAELRKMSSEAAVIWLIDNYPIDNIEYGNAFMLMSHRSWKKSDQTSLAEYYLQKMPFSNSKAYEAFLSFMSLSIFLKVVRDFLPLNSSSDVDLLIYHLKPVLDSKVNSSNDSEMIEEFFSGIS
ncbi:hypothetical protein [Enterovibrio norvegicus]|uniref:hypothetical protein n=1 Tax=Enterovibrio norvegicus TaxID=188144 RepID=UPI000C851988|nr:hypothetical protein [Enterovibrio norvegicus]PMN64500.1 hypothetical protein BCT27_11125 [Enterovibrio norvegicus]